jgi:hypothetical protein
MADQSNETRHASVGSDAGVHRLHDIVVEEVSLVDRAANKRRFLVVKRSTEMADNGKPKGRRETDEGPIADFQPDPVHDPTLSLDLGRVLFIPSVRVVTEEVFAEARRQEAAS